MQTQEVDINGESRSRSNIQDEVIVFIGLERNRPGKLYVCALENSSIFVLGYFSRLEMRAISSPRLPEK